MDTIHRLERATSKWWLWIWECWRLRKTVVQCIKDIHDLEQKHKELFSTHETAKDGTRALLRFVHARHRLDTKFDPGTARGVLQQSDTGGS